MLEGIECIDLEESEKRINSHHQLKLVQENYRILALENLELKGEIDLLRIKLTEDRCTSVLGGLLRSEEELPQPPTESGVGEIPALNLDVLQYESIQQEKHTERIPQSMMIKISEGNRPDC